MTFIYPTGSIGFNSPDKGDSYSIHMCYHGVVSHVNQNNDIYATANQNVKLSIQSSQKTWSVFAEAYEFSLLAIMQWHLNYEGPKSDFSTGQEFSQDPLVLAPELSAQPWAKLRPPFSGALGYSLRR